MVRFVLILLLVLVVPLRAETLSVVVEDYAPFAISNENGRVGGIAAEILAKVSKQTGLEFDITIYPLARIRELFDRKKIDISIAESPMWFDAAKIADFSFSEPYVHVYEYVYFNSNNVFPVNKPLDLQDKMVGIHHGYYYAAFDALFKQGIVKYETTTTSDNLLQKLNAGRTDVIFLDNFEFGYNLKKLKLSPKLFVRGMQLTDSAVSVMVRNNRKDVLDKINPVIQRLKADGTIKQIVDKYIGEP